MATAKKKVTKTTSTKQPAKKATSKVAVKKSVKKAVVKKEPTRSVKSQKSLAAKNAAIEKEEHFKKTGIFRCSVSGLPVKSEKPNLNPKTLQKLKESLIQERVRHQAQADELAQEAVDLITDREAGDTQFDEESGEGDSVAVERERSLFLSAEAQNTVKQIDRALLRIEEGTYGVCVPSSRRLPVPRLEALPWTEVCVDCKARSERRR